MASRKPPAKNSLACRVALLQYDTIMRDLRKGFTLREIFIVIIILGLLIAMAVPAVMKVREGSIKNQVSNNLSVIAATGRAMMLERNVESISFNELPNLQDKIKPVDGEDYSVLVMSSKGGHLTVTLSSNKTVSYPYQER